jgi:hypothetical protein
MLANIPSEFLDPLVRDVLAGVCLAHTDVPDGYFFHVKFAHDSPLVTGSPFCRVYENTMIFPPTPEQLRFVSHD